LVELLVVITILGLMFGVTGLALGSLRAPREAALVRALRAARAEAIRSGKAVLVFRDSMTAGFSTAASSDRPTAALSHRQTALFVPDGRAIGPGVDPLTGAPLDARR